MKHLLNTGIYEIKHVASNRRYVGSAAVLNVRLKAHLINLRKGKHHNRYLQFAWNKYGENSFEIRVVLFCSKRSLLFYEQRAIDSYRGNLYNLAPTAGSQFGWQPTEETKRKISEAKKGRTIQKPPPRTEEHRMNLSKANSGKAASEETRRKMSEAHKGQGVGREMPDEVKRKIAESQKGKVPWNKGKTGVYSEETLFRMSRQGSSPSEESRQKMSDSHKGQVPWNKGISIRT